MARLIDIVKKGSVDRSVTLMIIDSTDGTPETGVLFNTTGIDLWYRREGAAKVSITEATLSALTDAHADGGFLAIANGEYRLDLPDAALATGANYVDVGGTVTGMVVIGGRVRLVDFDPENATDLGLSEIGTLVNGAIVAATFGANALDAVWATADRQLTAFSVSFKTGYALSAAGVAAIWDALTSGITTAGSIGKRLIDYLTGDIFADTQALLARLTALRASYLDNLNVGGAVASSAEILAIQNNTRVIRVVPAAFERPDAGSTAFRIEVLLYDAVGGMEVPDSAPTIDVVNQAGTSRNANLDNTTMSLVSAGRYRSTYTIDTVHAIEQLIFLFSVVEGGATRVYGNASQVVDTTAVDFTPADRTKLDTLATDYSTARAAKLDNLDVTVGSRLASASYTTPPTAVQNRQEMDSNSAKLASIDGKTTNLPPVPASQAKLDTVESLASGANGFFEIKAAVDSISITGGAFTAQDRAKLDQLLTNVDDMPTNAELDAALAALDFGSSGGGGAPAEYVAGTPYATVTDMQQRFDDLILKQVTDAAATTIDVNAVTRALEDASNEIDGYLEGRYRLPLNPPPRSLRLLACNIAMYRLLVLRPLGDIEDARKRYEDSIKYLGRVSNGEIHLGLTKTEDEVQSTGSPKAKETDRKFSRGTLEGF